MVISCLCVCVGNDRAVAVAIAILMVVTCLHADKGSKPGRAGACKHMQVYIFAYTRIHAFCSCDVTCIHVVLCLSLPVCVCVFVWVGGWMYIHLYIYVHPPIYIYIYIYIDDSVHGGETLMSFWCIEVKYLCCRILVWLLVASKYNALGDGRDSLDVQGTVCVYCHLWVKISNPICGQRLIRCSWLDRKLWDTHAYTFLKLWQSASIDVPYRDYDLFLCAM